jgi:hypothetical protein
VTDAEFEDLTAELSRLLQIKRPGQRTRLKIKRLIARRVCCRDCDREDPEFYMIRNELWWAAFGQKRGGTGKAAGVLCLACLTKRLGRPLIREDFGEPPIIDALTDEEITL